MKDIDLRSMISPLEEKTRFQKQKAREKEKELLKEKEEGKGKEKLTEEQEKLFKKEEKKKELLKQEEIKKELFQEEERKEELLKGEERREEDEWEWLGETEEEDVDVFKKSYFWVMINTNKRIARDDETRCREVFEGVLQEFFENRELLESVFDTLEVEQCGDDKIRVIPSSRTAGAFFHSINSLYVVEIGPKRHCLHAHIDIDCSHPGYIQINPARFKEAINIMLTNADAGFLIHYIHFGLRANRDKIIEYMAKGFINEDDYVKTPWDDTYVTSESSKRWK